MGGYVGMKCKQKCVNERLSEQKKLMSHMKCKQQRCEWEVRKHTT